MQAVSSISQKDHKKWKSKKPRLLADTGHNPHTEQRSSSGSLLDNFLEKLTAAQKDSKRLTDSPVRDLLTGILGNKPDTPQQRSPAPSSLPQSRLSQGAWGGTTVVQAGQLAQQDQTSGIVVACNNEGVSESLCLG